MRLKHYTAGPIKHQVGESSFRVSRFGFVTIPTDPSKSSSSRSLLPLSKRAELGNHTSQASSLKKACNLLAQFMLSTQDQHEEKL